MADINTMILTVDLFCPRIHKKIKKVLYKLQDKWKIQSMNWDEENNKITISGPFCADELSKKLQSKAGNIITDIEIKEPEPEAEEEEPEAEQEEPEEKQEEPETKQEEPETKQEEPAQEWGYAPGSYYGGYQMPHYISIEEDPNACTIM